MQLLSQTDAAAQLETAGIKIGLSRTAGPNAHRLINESYGHFQVNATRDNCPQMIREFQFVYVNITITSDC